MLLEGALRLRQVFLDSFRGLTSHDRFSRDEMFATALTVHQYWLQFGKTGYESRPIFPR